MHSAVLNNRVKDMRPGEQNNQSAFYDDGAIFAEKLEVRRAQPEQADYTVEEQEGAVRRTRQTIVPNYDIISATISKTTLPARGEVVQRVAPPAV